MLVADLNRREQHRNRRGSQERLDEAARLEPVLGGPLDRCRDALELDGEVFDQRIAVVHGFQQGLQFAAAVHGGLKCRHSSHPVEHAPTEEV